MSQQDIEKKFTDSAAKLAEVKKEIAKIIFGQQKVIDQTLITLISGGHGLLVGVPGLAKTLLVETVGEVMGLDTKRIQCTPDLMPADILGTEVLEEKPDGTRGFRFIKGPIFTQLLMADEINRASPRTQSALLQSMQEYEISISGVQHILPKPFHVLATQNPIEQEGTYPLPEAQLDRFLMQIDVEYPDEATERQIMIATTSNTKIKANDVLSAHDLMNIQSLVRDMPIGQKVVDAILKILHATRPSERASKIVNQYVSWAPGPRGSQTLMLATRAKALLEGRTTPSTDDVVDLAEPVLKHRMALNYTAQAEGVTIRDIIRQACEVL